METETMEAGRKRERLMETAKSGRKRAGKKKASNAVSFFMQLTIDSAKMVEEGRLKRAVARRNEENPGVAPIVPEALTEQERAALLQEEMAREKILSRERSLQMHAERLREKEERPRAPPGPNQEDESEQDYNKYRQIWDMKWSKQYGSFEDTTSIPAMCFTDNPMPRFTVHQTTMQIFSVKVTEITGGLQWPLDVFGMIAMRDDLDHNRNIIFNRSRDNCQTLTQQGQHLVLTGPARAVVHEGHPSVYFEAILKVKGATCSEDRDLSLLISRCNTRQSASKSLVGTRCYRSKLSTLELAYGIIVACAEATIRVELVEGSWPEGFHGQLTACTASVPHMKVLLLDSGEKEAVVGDGGKMELSRRVVSVERSGQLVVCAVLSRGGEKVVEAETSFAPLEAGRSHDMLDVGSCKLRVTVAWSPILKGYPLRGFSLPSSEAVVS
ncbi:uncharacterized protein LOC119308505 [Triticum dicoccoides]|uniref:uncharacterized protein LOC119308505 n=1 Tax=Triticum dicoccoides TaxID=85692 RepID=UPI000E794B22|nr:uncharacterized protein LOC119308505 [Triticum dicoccoides]